MFRLATDRAFRWAQAERCRLLLGPADVLEAEAAAVAEGDGAQPTSPQLAEAVAALAVTGNFMFDAATHRDFLGAVLGRGIERSKASDLLPRTASVELSVPWAGATWRHLFLVKVSSCQQGTESAKAHLRWPVQGARRGRRSSLKDLRASVPGGGHPGDCGPGSPHTGLPHAGTLFVRDARAGGHVSGASLL